MNETLIETTTIIADIVVRNVTKLKNETINDPNHNDANWFGFNKIVEGQNLFDLFKSYIIYIVFVTVYNVILMSQQRKRYYEYMVFTMWQMPNYFHFYLPISPILDF